jgi:hypothetical protein
MLVILHTVLSFIGTHLWETAAAALALLSAALATYAREQVREGINWVLAPITHLLPWNRHRDFGLEYQQGLISDFTLVDVLLLDPDGKFARYQKISSYVVAANEIGTYQEGVTAEGRADAFFTMRGTIVETVKEHGFYVSQIDLSDPVPKGSRLTNIYMADLYDCFTGREEHWTQEIAFRTKHLTLQIHFPEVRPPKSLTCKTVTGTLDKPHETTAKIVDLFGKKSIVWEIDRPKTNEVLKLEWIW